MQIIDEVEPHKRCSYGGAIGYLDFSRRPRRRASTSARSSSRTALAHVQAGGGTVADAKPDYEYRESLQKAKAIFRAVDVAAEHPEWE